jgi:probable HAF family extracellular repeat protein
VNRTSNKWIVVLAYGAALLGVGCNNRRTDQESRPAASVAGLGDLPGGAFLSRANGISFDGSVVVGVSESSLGREAFRWSKADGMVGLGDLPEGEFESEASAASADGQVIVGVAKSTHGLEAFRWTSSTGMQGLGDLPGGDFRSKATAVSADGAVVVGTSHSDRGNEVFRWTLESGMVGLGAALSDPWPSGDTESEAFGVSMDGTIVVGQAKSLDLTTAFRWTSSEGLTPVGGFGREIVSTATAISGDGQTISGDLYSVTGEEAWAWTASGTYGLDPHPDWLYNYPSAASEDGSVIVGRMYADGVPYEALIWRRATAIQSVKSLLTKEAQAAWTLSAATGVSGNGLLIVGSGTNPSGQPEAWLVDCSEDCGEP